jgi:plasmid segregation protein ParM
MPTNESPQRSIAVTDNREQAAPLKVGIDDGFAYTKLALPDGRLFTIPSTARLGRSKVTWIDVAQRRIFEYATDSSIYSVGEVDAQPTRFDGYACSGMNRAIVQHALQQAGLEGAEVEAVSGLPVSAYYRRSGSLNAGAINDKLQNLLLPVKPRYEAVPIDIVFHRVIPEALAAWYDYVIVDEAGEARIDEQRLRAPVAVVDIGGRTTDTVVVRDQGILHDASGSVEYGLLDVKEALACALQERFDVPDVSERALDRAVRTRKVRLYGREYDIAAELCAARQELVERIYAETRRQLGRGVELDCVLFVGGGAVALADHVSDWFTNQKIANEPAFANARGMQKYLAHVCDTSAAA